MNQQLYLKISYKLEFLQLLKELSKINKSQDLDLVLEFVGGRFIKAEVYLLLVSFVSEMRAKGRIVNVSLVNDGNSSLVNYASRIDFFKHIGIEFEEKNQRHDVSGNLIPITNIEKGVMDLSREILKIFRFDFNMSDQDVSDISLAISEMFCNTSIHSKANSGGFLYCQKYRGINAMEFILVDAGIGIRNSLQKNPAYENISNAKALAKSIEYEVTCGEGRGHGLFFTSEYVRRNNGEMHLISGENRLVIKNQTVNCVTNSNWDGVYLRILFKFDTQVTYDSLMEEKLYSKV